MIHTKDSLRPKPSYPTYPPYHSGDYLEDFFYNRFSKELPEVNREFIGISWTTLYVENKCREIQPFLDSLDQSKKYFTVLQHDDAPLHVLPKDTKLFSAGGNYRGPGVYPIPLVCSPLNIKYEEKERDILASFVGSNTYHLRIEMAKQFNNKTDCFIYLKNWSPAVKKNDFELFINAALRSKYFLCPRGYGLNSFRLYEVMQLGCVPVVITDEFYLPWENELDWNSFAVLISADKLSDAYSILKNIPDSRYQKLKSNTQKLYSDYFSLDGVYKNILKRLSNE